MTVHINGSKGKDLYYGGSKIREAYYGSTKVYSSGPLYYCYTEGGFGYAYFTEEMNVVGKTKQLFTNSGGYWVKANSSSELVGSSNLTVSSLTSNGFVSGSSTFTRYIEGDLYT